MQSFAIHALTCVLEDSNSFSKLLGLLKTYSTLHKLVHFRASFMPSQSLVLKLRFALKQGPH